MYFAHIHFPPCSSQIHPHFSTHPESVHTMCWVCALHVYGFRADHFVLNNQLAGSSLGKTNFHSFIHAVPLIHILGWYPPQFPFHIRVLISAVLVWVFFRVAILLRDSECSIPVLSRRSNLTAGFPVLWLLQPSHNLSFECALSSRGRICVADVYVWPLCIMTSLGFL